MLFSREPKHRQRSFTRRGPVSNPLVEAKNGTPLRLSHTPGLQVCAFRATPGFPDWPDLNVKCARFVDIGRRRGYGSRPSRRRLRPLSPWRREPCDRIGCRRPIIGTEGFDESGPSLVINDTGHVFITWVISSRAVKTDRETRGIAEVMRPGHYYRPVRSSRLV
jgi:hypothetical protein